MQPRTPVTERVAEALETSGRTDAEEVIGFTYRALAARTYDTDWPTAAELSAVRRSVAKLVAAGRAKRGKERMMAWKPWCIDLDTVETHERTSKYGFVDVYANPGGVAIFRTPTEGQGRSPGISRPAGVGTEEVQDLLQQPLRVACCIRSCRGSVVVGFGTGKGEIPERERGASLRASTRRVPTSGWPLPTT
jgi:hypothetical protein